MKLAWTIAGSDPSGAAGIQADQKTFAALGVHACSVITAVTAQSFGAFEAAMPLAAIDVKAQLLSLNNARMPAPAAVKIGMLGSLNTVKVVADELNKLKAFVVLDPVQGASAGGFLRDAVTTEAMVASLFPRADLVTPNVPEAALLSGVKITTAADMPAAALALHELGARRVLIKGGHLAGPLVHDYLSDGTQSYWLTSVRREADVRGTGCSLASAIAAYIALGHALDDSLVLAKTFLGAGIRNCVPTEAGPALFGWASASEFRSEDSPWRTQSLLEASERPSFPACGPYPLGFYPIVDRAAWVRRLVACGATTIQLRIKDLEGEALREELAAAIQLCHAANVRLFINDHWALAIELGAYGVHLGQEDLEQADVAALAHAGLRLGISSHSPSEAAVAHGLRPSYLALGPIFPTTCKSLRFGPHGLGRIAEWRARYPYPIVAIGGLKAEHAAQARSLGADGVAVISDVTQAADPEARAKLWVQQCE